MTRELLEQMGAEGRSGSLETLVSPLEHPAEMSDLLVSWSNAGEHHVTRAGEEQRAAHRGTRVDLLLEREPVWSRDFTDLRFEWRRLFSELFGTFLLVTVGVGGGVLESITHGGIGRIAEVTAPGLLVTAVILFMGAVSGAHLNPVVSIAFALRGDFGWTRVPGYIVAQLAGAAAASLLLRITFGSRHGAGSTLPGNGFSSWQAFTIEALLTLGLVSTILGTASTAQNIGTLSAFGVGSYIILAGLWAGPVSGASMNPARSFGPALVDGNFGDYWIYLAGPLLGATLAVAAALILRGPGGDQGGRTAAQGTLTPPSAPRSAQQNVERPKP
jgi:aquaporin Z